MQDFLPRRISGSRRYIALACGALLALAGCGGTHDSSVSGRVTLGGQPLTTGMVTFNPVGPGPACYGRIGADGAYTIQTGNESGLPPGEYKVTVMATEVTTSSPGGGAPPIGRRLTPEIYGRVDTTELKAQVVAGSNTFDFDLKPDAK